VAGVFRKLNLKDQTEIVVLNAPPGFEPELAALSGVRVVREAALVDGLDFALVFVTARRDVEAAAAHIDGKAKGDAIVWFAYPKAASKRYRSDINRDTGWEALGGAGFEPVRQVAIDEDWSALRFRRVQYTKSMKRRESLALTEEGKTRSTG
jgi:hypothetical protein